MRKIFVTIVLVVFMLPCLASAVDLFGFGPRVGYFKTKDADEGKLMFGAAARLRLSPLLGIEGSIDYRSEKYANGALTMRSWPIQATGIIYPLPIVYGLIGAGWYNTTMDFDQSRLGFALVDDKTDQEFGWHFGGGLEIPFGPVTTLAADVRYTFIDYNFSEMPGSEEMDSDFYTITVGLLLGL